MTVQLGKSLALCSSAGSRSQVPGSPAPLFSLAAGQTLGTWTFVETSLVVILSCLIPLVPFSVCLLLLFVALASILR